jgi:hypothetical protein
MDAIENDVRYRDLVRKEQAGELTADEAAELAELLTIREESEPLAGEPHRAE